MAEDAKLASSVPIESAKSKTIVAKTSTESESSEERESEAEGMCV